MEILDKAKEGLYSQFEVQRGLPINLLVKYFKQTGDRWQIDAGIRQMVKYQKFNLLTNPSALGRFDVIFCRNVLIYFDAQDEATSVVWGMPGAVATAGLCSAVLPLPEIASYIRKFAMRTAA